MNEFVISCLKRIIITVVMGIITSIVGLMLNQLSIALTNSLYDSKSFLKPVKGLDTYEKQIHEFIVNPKQITETLESVGGLRDIKEDITANILLPLQYPHIFFSSTSLMPTRGIILHGPPGTGKTLLAKAIAAEANVPFISLSLSALENKYYGESSKLIRGAFSLARKIQPCIVFFDEIDGLLRKRLDSDQSATYGFKTELLSQIDGMSSKNSDSIFVIGTTNNLESLDSAIKRRLPKIYKVNLPNTRERLDILKLKTLEEVDMQEDILLWVSKITDTFSGSELQDLVRQACAIRLREQCNNDEFKKSLTTAKNVTDMPTLYPLTKAHFTIALANSEKMIGIIEALENANSFDADDDEDLPPPPV